MNKKEFQRQFEERQQQAQLNALDANQCRAQSVSIGTSASGTTEITMRGVNGNFLWEIYQPVQVVELIHQLSASIGCHINLQPRKDFASWRVWRGVTDEERRHLNGFPPFADMLNGDNNYGSLDHKIKRTELKPNLIEKGVQNEQIVATQKTVGRKRTKRAAAAA